MRFYLWWKKLKFWKKIDCRRESILEYDTKSISQRDKLIDSHKFPKANLSPDSYFLSTCFPYVSIFVTNWTEIPHETLFHFYIPLENIIPEGPIPSKKITKATVYRFRISYRCEELYVHYIVHEWRALGYVLW